MNTQIYSHWHGEKAVPGNVSQPLRDMLNGIQFDFVHGGSRELRKQILVKLRAQGWSSKVRLTVNSRITITSMRGSLALCLQTGNMSRFYADLLKLQYLFKNEKASAAIYIIPTKRRAKQLGSNLAHFERFVEELNLFKHIYTVPTLVVGLD